MCLSAWLYSALNKKSQQEIFLKKLWKLFNFQPQSTIWTLHWSSRRIFHWNRSPFAWKNSKVFQKLDETKFCLHCSKSVKNNLNLRTFLFYTQYNYLPQADADTWSFSYAWNNNLIKLPKFCIINFITYRMEWMRMDVSF